MKKTILLLTGFFAATTLLVSCGEMCATSTKPKVETPKKTINFTYKPETSALPGSQKVGFILMKPTFDNKFLYGKKSPFKEFANSIASDIEQIITTKGFTFKGPFDSYDEITYSDKKNSEIVIRVEIESEIQQISGGWVTKNKTNYGPNGTYMTQAYMLDADLAITGKIKLTFSEIMTNEKIKIKNLEIPAQPFHVKSENKYDSKDQIPLDDAGVWNPLLTALEGAYTEAMKKTAMFIDPEEIKTWLPQIQELRNKK